MRYFLAIFLPPIAVLLCAKPITALLNVVLWICGIVPGVIHAFMVISSHKADVRMKKHTKAVTAAIREQRAPV